MARKDTISQYSTDTIGVGIFDAGDFADPDADLVNLDVERIDDGVLVLNGVAATKDDVGQYSYQIGPAVTNTQGEYKATWNYEMSGDPRIFVYEFLVGDQQPVWDSLTSAQKAVVEGIYFKLSDGFDSTKGGPYLWELPQSHFNMETIARLTVVDGMNMINFSGFKAFQKPYTFGGTGGSQIPESWYGLVQKAGFYETLKHLARSYLEIPMPVNVQTAHLDRTAYSQAWMAMANAEKEELVSQVHMIKRAMALGVRYRSKLVAGGLFPVSYLNPARPRWPYTLSRFY